MTMLTVGSVFAGIEGFGLGFERAGAKIIWNCEIDANCRKVLRHHYPGVPRFKDVRTVTGAGLRRAGLVPDVLVGGFPCQDLSVAGARAGLDGERSGLFFEFARIAEEAKPEWLVIENVPGLLSAGCKPPCVGGCVATHGGAMGTVIGTLADIGYVGAWRVLDAQYFGVAQRRRRVFIVGHLGDGRRAAEVLLEPEGGGGDPPARRAPGEGTTRGAGGCVAGDGDVVTGLTGSFGNGGADDNKAQAGWLIPAVSHSLCAPSTGGAHNDHNGETLLPVAFHMTQDPITGDISPAIGGVKPTTGYSTVAVGYRKATTSHGPENDWERWEEAEHTNTLDAGSNVTRNAHAVVQGVALRGRDGGATAELGDDVAFALRASQGGGDKPHILTGLAVAFQERTRAGGANLEHQTDLAYALLNPGEGGRASDRNIVTPQLAVRRLTPLECLRLQGFPDDHLDGLGLADSVKYRCIGNAVAVPVVEWIARRLLHVHDRGM